MAAPVSDSYSAASGKPIYGGRVDPAGANRAPVWAGLSSPLELAQGRTLDIRGYASDPDHNALTFALESGTLPTGVTFSNGVFAAASDATLGNSGDLVVSADDGVASAILPLFGLTSAAGGSNLPFTFGHVFAQGDVPTGSYVESDLTDWQAVPTTYWPDGSVRHAIIAGRATCTANTKKSVALSSSGTARTGTALSEADLTAALPATTLVCGAETITLGTLVGTAQRTVCAGPIMSNWLYRKALTGSNHLVAWFDVRLYKGGTVEIFPWIENGYLLVASPTNDVRDYTLTIGGTQVFSATGLDIKHHTRVPLLTGAAHSYWSAGATLDPAHDVTYLRKTKMVPNITATQDSTALSDTGNYAVTYTPNWLGNTKAAMGDTGFGNHIGVLPQWSAGFVASGDARTYKSVVVNGMAGGSWPIHYRDETSNEPFKFTDFPSASIVWGGSPTIPGGTGGVNASADPEVAHQPSLGFLPWLLTGRWYFLDEQLAWANWNYLNGNQTTRDTSDCVFFETQTRARAWNLRTLAQTLAVLPSSHPCYASYKRSWEANTAAYEARYITGARDSNAWKNSLGWCGLYSSQADGGSLYFNGNAAGYWWDANWMQAIFALAFGSAWDMDLPQTTASKASHQAVRDFTYRPPIQMAGDGSTGTYSYRRFASFQMPIGTDAVGSPPEAWLADWGSVYAVQQAYGLDGDTPYAAMPAGNDIYYGAAPATTDMWAYHSAVCFGRCALVLAADHGVAGAAAGYARVTGASNYSEADFATTPIWGIVPR